MYLINSKNDLFRLFKFRQFYKLCVIFVYDIIYTPGCTRFLREAKARGHRVTNGVAMLVGQGAEALSLWTGVQPDESVMEQALLAALSEKENGGRA